MDYIRGSFSVFGIFEVLELLRITWYCIITGFYYNLIVY
jgi:hypothetical protein